MKASALLRSGGYVETRRIENDVKRFIVENFLFSSELDSIANDVSFIEKGIVDSTGVLELIEFIEKNFGIDIDDEEVVPDNLDSIEKIVGFVARKTCRTALPIMDS